MLDRNRILWCGTVRALPFAEQLRAASIAGCGAISTGCFEYLTHISRGLNAKEMLRMAADAGVRITHLDPLVRWVPNWLPAHPNADFPIAILDFDEDHCWRVAEALELSSVSVVGTFPVGSVPFDEMVDCFGALCQRAAKRGIRCDLEFVPLWGIPNFRLAWDIVRTANQPNSGIVFDFYHYTRGGPDDELLKSIDGKWITGVQIDDGDAEIPPGVSMFMDTIFRRKLPGQGGFRVREIIAMLRGIGGLNNYGPEVFSGEMDALGADEIGARCRDALAWALG